MRYYCKEMSESSENVGPIVSMAGRRVDFGKAGEGDGLAWGVEVDIDISNSLVRTRFQESSFKIPDHIKNVKFLELAPQEALPPEQRNIRSKMKPRSILGASSLIPVATPSKPRNPMLEKIRNGFNLLSPEDQKRFESLRAMITWTFGPANGSEKRFNDILKQSKGDTLVIVHGHSHDLSGMGENNTPETRQ